MKIFRPPLLLWIILLFIILPILAFPELIFGQRTLYWTDLSWIHYPRHHFAASEWLAGRIPLWDPYEDTGIPLLAETQIGVLYPFSLIFLLPFSPALELSLFILLHFSLAATFTLILGRTLGLSWPAATMSGLAYGFGGFLMAQVPNLNIMTGAVWLPLILSGVIMTLRTRTWSGALLTGIPLTMQILTAQPQIVFYTLIVIGGYGLYRLAGDLMANGWSLTEGWTVLKSAGLLLIVVISALFLAAPQLLPTFELQQLSVRATERDLEFLTENSLQPVTLLTLLWPGAFGNNVIGFRIGDPFQEVFLYVGLVPLFLTLFSGGQRRQRDFYFFYILLAVGLLLALGRYTPLYQTVLQYLPGFALFRIPSRWLMAVNLALAILAGFGLENLQQRNYSRSTLAVFWTVSATLLSTAILLWLFKAQVATWSQAKLFQVFLTNGFSLNPAYATGLGIWQWLRLPAVLFIGNLSALLILMGLWLPRRLSFNAFATALIVVTALDLMAAGGTTVNPTKPNHWWQELSGGAEYVLANVADKRVFPLGMGSEEATVSHLGQYFPSFYQVRSAGGHGSSLRLARFDTFAHDTDPVQGVRVLGVRYLLTLGAMGADVAATYPLVFQDGNSFVYENPQPLPRAFMVHKMVTAQTAEQALAHFQARAIDPAQTVIIEPAPAQTPPQPQAATGSTATISQETPQFLQIQTIATEAGYLVLLDTYYPGWFAMLDGQPTPLYRANYIGRAVFVPAGEHTVEFFYQPRSFWWGVTISLLMGVVIIGTIVWGGPSPGEPTRGNESLG